MSVRTRIFNDRQIEEIHFLRSSFKTKKYALLLRPKSKLYVSQAPPASSSTPASKIFHAFPFNIWHKIHLYIFNFSLIWPPVAAVLFLVGWLISGANPKL